MSDEREKRMSVGFKRIGACALILLLAIGIAACGSDEGDDTPSAAGGEGAERSSVRVAFPQVRTSALYPVEVAEELGFFEEEGIDFEFIAASEDIPLQTYVTNGDADLSAPGGSEVLFGAAAGADYRVVFEDYTKTANGVVVPEESDVTAIEGLAGRTVGLASDEDRSFLAIALEAGGLALDDVKPIVVGASGPTVANALSSGRVDAYVATFFDFAAIEAAGISLRRITPDEVSDEPTTAFIASADMIEQDADTIERFLRAYAKAVYVGMVNPEAVAAINEKRVPEEYRDRKFGLALTEEAIASHVPNDEERIGDLRQPVWANVHDRLLDAGELEQPVDLGALLDDRFVERANEFDRADAEAAAEEFLAGN